MLLTACAAPAVDAPQSTGTLGPLAGAVAPVRPSGDPAAGKATDPAPGASSTPAPRADRQAGEARVALVLPLSADPSIAVVARAMKQAAEMALFELDTPALKLVVKDDKGTPEGAAAAVSEAIAEGTELVAGPLLSRSVAAAAGPARRASVPVVAFSNDRKVAGDGVFLLSYLTEPEVDRVVGFAVAQGKRRFAGLVLEDAYGQIAATAFREAVARHGGTIAGIETGKADANGFLEPARRIAELLRQSEAEGSPVDALFIPGGPEAVPSLGPLLAHVGIDTARVKLIGTGGWDGPHAGRDATLVGAWYPGPDPRGWTAFAERYAKSYGGPPPRIAGLAYDVMVLAATLASGSPGQRFAPAALTRPGGFNGVDGVVRLTPDGLSQRTLAVFEVQKLAPTVVDPAPLSLSQARLATSGGRID